jgi:hypothetical protein
MILFRMSVTYGRLGLHLDGVVSRWNLLQLDYGASYTRMVVTHSPCDVRPRSNPTRRPSRRAAKPDEVPRS